MKAIVYEDVRRVSVAEVADAAIEEPTDALIRITSSAICGSDLHMYGGRTGASPGLVLGHEPLGVVEAVGSAIESVRVGQRVVIPTHLYCGLCYNCVRGYSAARAPWRLRRCLRVRGHGQLPRGAGRAAAGAVRLRERDPGVRRAAR
jgi:glutathione-independent formaldehyde dehydrogenase